MDNNLIAKQILEYEIDSEIASILKRYAEDIVRLRLKVNEYKRKEINK